MLAETTRLKSTCLALLFFLLPGLTLAAVASARGEHMLELAQNYQSESRQREIDELTRRNERQAAELKHRALEQRWLWTVFGGSLLLLTVTGYFLLRQRRANRLLEAANNQLALRDHALNRVRDITERRCAEQERQEHLHFLECLDWINRTIQGANSMEQMMSAVLDIVLSVFACDRVFLMYPCDPDAVSWSVPMECHRPEYPGAQPLGAVMPMDAVVAQILRVLLAADGPVKFGSGTAHALPAEVAERFGFQCFMSMALYPKTGKPWQFGMHQCSRAHGWTPREVRLFQEIGRRLADSLSSLLAYRELQDSERQFRTLAENSPDPIFRYDRNCRRIYVNPAVERLAGKPADILLNDTPQDARILSHTEAEKLVGCIRQVLESGRPAACELECVGADGTARYFHSHCVPEPGENGDVEGVLLISRDITERKQAEVALAERERQFRTLAESLPDNIVRYDLAGRAIYINPVLEKNLGAQAEEMLGRTIREIHPHGEFDDYAQVVDHVLATGEYGEIEKILPAPDGQSTHVHQIRVIAEHGENGAVAGILAIGRDVTAFRTAEQQLRESHVQLRELSARREAAREEERKHIAREIHDELGQLLTALRMNVSLLRLQFGRNRTNLLQHVQGTMELVDQTIQVVRGVASSLRPAVLDMGIVSALEWLSGEFGKHSGLPCHLHLCEENMVMDDQYATTLFRIVQEALTNVARYAQAGRVDVALTRDGGEYRLSIRDDGRGFDPGAPTNGTFGLLGMKERALLLGGSVEITSRPGAGTLIEVRIPAGRESGTVM